MNSLGVIRRYIKSHLYLVASFGICNLYLCFMVFVFLYSINFIDERVKTTTDIVIKIFLLPLSFLNCTYTFVTCSLNINESINQSRLEDHGYNGKSAYLSKIEARCFTQNRNFDFVFSLFSLTFYRIFR